MKVVGKCPKCGKPWIISLTLHKNSELNIAVIPSWVSGQSKCLATDTPQLQLTLRKEVLGLCAAEVSHGSWAGTGASTAWNGAGRILGILKGSSCPSHPSRIFYTEIF